MSQRLFSSAPRQLCLLSALVCALAACSADGGSGDGVSAAPSGGGDSTAASEKIALTETAWLSVSTDGAVYTTFLDPDGRYRDLRNGELALTGGWEENAQGQLCFAPDAGKGECWAIGALDENGEVRATDADGRAIMLKRITYAPPSGARRAITPDAEDTAEEG